MLKTYILFRRMHSKCRNAIYPGSSVMRTEVPDEKVKLSVQWDTYQPVTYTSPNIKNKPWADPEIGPDFNPVWNNLDGPVNRVSYTGVYNVQEGKPINPRGRTGVVGRGVLGRWGPNHAADPIVTRWSRQKNNEIVKDATTLAPILQFVAIQRRDCNEWALPGGMVDPGEKVSATLMREFMEEALNSLENDIEHSKKIVRQFFSDGQEVYRGYVDDPRNTDNAWMETVAYNFHDEGGSSVGKIPLQAGDDAKAVRWMDVCDNLNLYASHKDLLKIVAQARKSHW